MLNVGICGASGYTGIELLRILSTHPLVKVTVVTSEKSAGKLLKEVFPHFTGILDLKFKSIEDPCIIKDADFIFLALPHGTSQEKVSFFYNKGKYIVDLSADFRLKDVNIYKKWYGIQHKFIEILKDAVYGLPETNREKISKARLIANPGCYPTSIIIALYPAIKEDLINLDNIIIDSKSGTSGAGRVSNLKFSFSELNESFMAYALSGHRHIPEIEEQLSEIAARQLKVCFIPHLLPVNRGILTTIYCKLKKKVYTKEVLDIYKQTYEKESFVRVYEEGAFPNIKNVRGTNFCDLGIMVNERTNTLLIISAIDNLIKGASGQAVQNMNIMMGFEETTGLKMISLFP